MKSPIGHLAIILSAFASMANGQSFYKETPLFTTAPPETKSVTDIGNFGTVGIAIDLHQPAFTMWIGDVAPKNVAVDVEPGGFGTKNPVGWKSRLMVFKRR